MDRVDLFIETAGERIRQDEKWGKDFTGRDPNEWLAILLEEVGEVAEEVDPDKIVAELIQVAAVALSWAEHLPTQGRVDQFRDGQRLRVLTMELGMQARAILEERYIDDPAEVAPTVRTAEQGGQ